MSYLLEALGRGLLSDLRAAFQNQLPAQEEDQPETLIARLEASPASFDLTLRLGLAYLREGRLADARRTLENARSLDPAASQPLIGLACVYDEQGQLDQALECLQAAQQRDEHDPAIAFGIAFW